MERPIFILGLQRGGTNQVLNLLRSHPDTTWPDGEFHEVLRPSRRQSALEVAQTLLGYLPILIRAGDILNPWRPLGSRRLNDGDRRRIGRALLRAARANEAEVTRYKKALERQGFYTQAATKSRVIVKLVNYNVSFAQDLREIFPDARFVGVVREASGVCESMMSRGAELDAVISLYNFFGRTLLELAEDTFPIEIFRFEDLMRDFRATAGDIYWFCDLDAGATTGLCLQDKRRVMGSGQRVVGMEKTDAFYHFDRAQEHMRSDVNAAASSRLAPEMLLRIAGDCGAISERFGYDSGYRTGMDIRL